MAGVPRRPGAKPSPSVGGGASSAPPAQSVQGAPPGQGSTEPGGPQTVVNAPAPIAPPKPSGTPGADNPPDGYSAPNKPAPVHPTVQIPPSQFHTADKPPSLPLEPLEMPQTHVTPEFCLEQMARVLEELAEKQEEPDWVTTHIQLAEAWRAAAEMLLGHAVNAHSVVGDAHIKQQQIDQQHDVHAQTLAQKDQQHFQTMKQGDDQHAQRLSQNDEMHQKNLEHQDEQNKIQLDVTKKKAQVDLQKSDMDLKSTKQRNDLTLKQQQEQHTLRMKTQQQAAKDQATRRAQAAKKPASPRRPSGQK